MSAEGIVGSSSRQSAGHSSEAAAHYEAAVSAAPELFSLFPNEAGVEIHRGHATDLIGGVDTFDLLATDPPYAMGGEGAEHAIGAVVATTLREAGHRLAPGGWAVVYAASSWRSTYYMVEALRGVLTPVRTATWVKPVARTKVRTPGWCWASVNVLLFKKGKPEWGDPSDALDWIEEPPLMNGRRAELPPRVAAWSIAPFVKPGGRMLDPFAGSGALSRAAADAGMHAAGFEMGET